MKWAKGSLDDSAEGLNRNLYVLNFLPPLARIIDRLEHSSLRDSVTTHCFELALPLAAELNTTTLSALLLQLIRPQTLTPPNTAARREKKLILPFMSIEKRKYYPLNTFCRSKNKKTQQDTSGFQQGSRRNLHSYLD